MAPVHQSSIHWIISFGGNAGVLSQAAAASLQPKPKIVPEFKNALHLIWSALPEKAIDNAVKHKTTPSDCRHVFQSTVDILNI